MAEQTGGWIEREARNADPSRDRVVLENPETVRELDAILRETFHPAILKIADDAGYVLQPRGPDLDIRSETIGPQFGRTLRFILFDDFAYPFFRGGLSISRVGFMVEREIALGFPRDTNPDLLLRILGHEAFAGNMPTLHVEASVVHPEWNVHYVFTLSAGDGHQTGSWTLHQAALGNMEEVIKGSIALYEAAMVDGLVTDEDVTGFLALAERWYASR